jgi:predicted DCC family thiol-disulfide oxidoreductase YuxK
MTAKTTGSTGGGIILFDGVCNLCENSVRFVIRHDPEGKFLFAPLQSDYARMLIKDWKRDFNALQAGDLDSFVLLADGKISLRSDAWLSICRQLDGWPKLLGVFQIVPRFIRDAVYDFIGRHRYRWFGKKPSCMIPAPDIQQRFRR